MAKSTSGKWVSRVASQGGGKTYRRARPSNFYGVLIVIVVLGLALTVYSRYEYQNPVKKRSTSTTVAPAIGSTLYAGLSIEACGEKLPYLNPDPNYKGGFIVGPDNVIRLSPVAASDAGDNATLKQFAAEFPGLVATSSKLAVPTKTGTKNPATTYANGDVCPAGSKYAGKKGRVVYAYWTTFGQKKPTLTTDPASIKFVKELRVTMAFEPESVTPTVPSAKTVDEMVLYTTTPSTTTTAPTTTTTAPSTTTTAGPATTTTAPPTTTTKG